MAPKKPWALCSLGPVRKWEPLSVDGLPGASDEDGGFWGVGGGGNWGITCG